MYLKIKRGWGCSSVVEHLSSIYENLGSISSTIKKKKEDGKSSVYNENIIFFSSLERFLIN
jgi:hypothetical protein